MVFLLGLKNLVDLPYSQNQIEVEAATINHHPVVEEQRDINWNVRQEVEKEFGKNHIMVFVAECESQMRQYDEKTGEVLNSYYGTPDKGVFQINLPSHEDTLIQMGLDYKKLSDNIKYARFLYDNEGTGPWSASQACWSKHLKP